MKIIYRNLLVCITLLCSSLPILAQPGTWTWMHGPQTGNCAGVYGTQGVPAPGNMPPCLYEMASWTDQAGNFWVFGGLMGGFDLYSDLWKFDPTTNMWTWMHGPQFPNSSGVYGTQGVPAPGNYPGSRSYGPNNWIDNNGDLWLMGGYGYDATGSFGAMNDLWKYTIATNQWTWMKGPNIASSPPVMGTMGVPNPANIPPPVSESSCTWVDASNNLWFYGGVDINFSPLEQVWRYNTSTNEWTWMKGSTNTLAPPVFGSQGVASPSNTPGSRGTYASWVDCAGDFWMFGGTDFGSNAYADLWKFDPVTVEWTWMDGTSTPNPTVNFTSQCTPSTNGHPSAAWENRAVWTDSQGRLWGFGGSTSILSFDCGNLLWCYDPPSQSFTWVKGSTAPNPPAVFGTQGIGAPGNTPGALGGSASFTDLQGNLWLFGGWDFFAGPTYGTLWKYTPDPACPVGGGSGGNASAAFSAQPTSGCVPLPVAFTNTSTGAGSYDWDFGDGGTSSATNPSHTYSTPGTWDVMLIAHGGCGGGADTAFQTITVSPGITVSLGPDQTICAGDSIQLNAGNPGSTYLWDDNTTNQTLTVSTTSTHWVQVTDPNGCIARDTVAVTVLSVPFSLGADHVICTGASVTLDAGNPGSTYLWSNSAQTQTITVSSGGDHWVQVTLPSGCIVRDTVAVTLLPLPVVNLGPDIVECIGASVPLDAGNHPGATLLWSTNESTQAISVSNPGTYWVRVTDAAGCVGSDSIHVVFDQMPTVSLGPDTTICDGASITLDAANPGNQILWSTGATTQTITVSQAGQYTVYVTTPIGCSAGASLVLTVTPDFALELGPDTIFCEDKFWRLSTGHTAMTHLWSSGQQTESITAFESGLYTVEVSNPCFTHTDAIRLTFRSDSAGPFIPTAFTPNGDGLNDVLIISGLHTDDGFSMQVYDRWGMRIFTSEDARIGWDGTLHGMDSPEGIYVIRVQVTDCRGVSRPRGGTVTLLR